MEHTGHCPSLGLRPRVADSSDSGVTHSLGGWLSLRPFKSSMGTMVDPI